MTAALTDRSIGGVLLRWAVPALIAIPVPGGLLALLGAQLGYYSVEFSVALSTMLCVIAGVAVIFRVVALADRMDRRRLYYEEALKEAYDAMEARVAERTTALMEANQQLTIEIEDRKNAEEAVQERERTLRGIFNAAKNVSLIITDVEGEDCRILEFSPGAELMFGYSRQEAIGKRVAMLHMPEDVRRFPETIDSLRVNHRTGFNGETMLVRKSGEAFPALFTTYPLFDERGVMTGTLGVSFDITAQKKLERELRESNELLEKIFATTYFHIAYLDTEFNFIRVNKAYAAAGLNTPEFYEGKNHFELYPDTENEVIFRRVRDSGEPYSAYEKPFVYRDQPEKGVTYWDWNIQPVKNAAGSIEGLVLCLIDRTELHRNREKLVNAEKELLESKRLSDIGTLAATVAHELRNPLAAIRIASFNIRRKYPEPSLKNHLDNIEKKVAESDRIINNLLFYSRLRMPSCETASLYDILEEVAGHAQCKFEKQLVLLKKQYQALQGRMMVLDPLQMKEVFSNILDNAYEALLRDSGSIEIEAVCREKEGAVAVMIRDNGVGIAPEHLEKISEPFFTTKSKGTGLGLTVCYQVVHLHDGTIAVESIPRQGTCFTVTLPAGGPASVHHFILSEEDERYVSGPE
jgi:PAS domain S-box-containing protein